MPSWNELFLREENVTRVPEREIYRFVSVLERCFSGRPLRIWDLCCGAGRHTVAMARSGHDTYASDAAPNGIARTREWLSELDLSARTSVCDMTRCPWPDVMFHGALSWDALHHNTLASTERAITGVHRQLIPGGLFLATLKSTRADSCGRGQEIEPNTFVQGSGMEAGVARRAGGGAWS
jgi:ubiquinone/menaquinone biosynthesis C-methylase UbiE